MPEFALARSIRLLEKVFNYWIITARRERKKTLRLPSPRYGQL